MSKNHIRRTHQIDEGLAHVESLPRKAATSERLNPGPHIHTWTKRTGRERLFGDVWQQPHECRCGATAWKQTWCGKVEFVDIQQPPPAVLLQNDVWHTPLPNGMLRWFGFDFDRAVLPHASVLRDGEEVQWIGTGQHFIHKTGISDATVMIEVDEFGIDNDNPVERIVSVIPKGYRIYINAHGMDSTEVSYYQTWHEVQQHCKRAENNLDETHWERHALCQDEEGRLTEHSCKLCEGF